MRCIYSQYVLQKECIELSDQPDLELCVIYMEPFFDDKKTMMKAKIPKHLRTGAGPKFELPILQSQSTRIHDSGVNCMTARFKRPRVFRIFLRNIPYLIIVNQKNPIRDKKNTSQLT